MNRLEWFFVLVDRVTGPARRITTAFETIRRGLGNVSRQSEKAENKVEEAARKIGNISGALRGVSATSIHQLSVKLDEARMRAERLRATLVGLLAGGMAAGGAVLLGRSIIQGVATIEQQRIALETLLKDAKRGQAALQWAAGFADVTPFETVEVLNSLKLALAMGFTTRQVEKLLTTLGDTAAGTGARLDDLVLIFGQIRAAGRVATDDLNQLAERGIKVWEFLSKALGKTIPEIRELVEKGEIDAATGMRAILAGMEDAYGGMMERQSRTINGLLSTLRSRPVSVMLELDKENALRSFKTLLDNLVRLTDFSIPAVEPEDPAERKRLEAKKRLRAQFVESVRSIFDTIFAPFVRATSLSQDQLIAKLQSFEKLVKEIFSVIRAGAQGFIAGFAGVLKVLSAVWQGLSGFLKALGITLPQNAEGIARLVGFIIGLVAAWKVLNFVTLGATGALTQFLGVGLTRLPALFRLFTALGPRIAGIGTMALTSMGVAAIAVVGLSAAVLFLIRHWGEAREAVLRAWIAIRAGIGVVINVVTAIIRLPKTAGAVIREIVASAIENTKKGLASLRALFSKIADAIVGGLQTGFDKVKGFGKLLAEKLIKAANAVLGIRSPSRVFAYIGRMSALGLALGLLSGAPFVTRAAETLSQGAIGEGVFSQVFVESPIRSAHLPTPNLRFPVRPPEEKQHGRAPLSRGKGGITVNVYVNIHGGHKDVDELGANIAQAVERHLINILERAAREEGYGFDA